MQFNPSTGVVELHIEKSDPDEWNPSSAILSSGDGARVFSAGRIRIAWGSNEWIADFRVLEIKAEEF